MLMRWRVVLSFVCLCLCRAAVVCAQQPETSAQTTPETSVRHTTLFDRLQAVSDKQETVSKDQLRLIGNVELPVDDQTKMFADQIDLFFDTKKLVAVGNVVFAGTEGRITAEKIEFNVENNTGTFTEAFGIMSLGPKADRKQFGNQDADVYFFGQTIE